MIDDPDTQHLDELLDDALKVCGDELVHNWLAALRHHPSAERASGVTTPPVAAAERPEEAGV